jgi:hypothetical protein
VLDAGLSEWGERGQTPGTGRRTRVALTIGRDPGNGDGHDERRGPAALWSVTCEMNRERSDLDAFAPVPDPAAGAVRTWWGLYARLGI